MILFDRLTEGHREKDLLDKIRQGIVTDKNIEEHCLPFFVKVQIQTNSRCNGACVTCPYPQTSKILPQGEMTEETFLRIVDQLKGKQVERTSLFLMNEPLVDKRIERFCKILKKEVPDTKALIFTNGVLLTKDRVLSLADAGLDEVDISVIGFSKGVHSAMMQGCDFDTVMKNLKEVGGLIKKQKLQNLKVKVIGLDVPGIEEGQERFRQETGLDIFIKPVTNRAGLIDTKEMGPQEKGNAVFACQRPFVKAYILYNGDMILCNCDWMRTRVIGNIYDKTLEELWMSPMMMEIRKNHLKGDLSKSRPCAECDYPYLI